MNAWIKKWMSDLKNEWLCEPMSIKEWNNIQCLNATVVCMVDGKFTQMIEMNEWNN